MLPKGRPPVPDRPLADIREWKYSGNRVHPTEKHVDILTPLIETFTRPGEMVLDPFAGSGSTCVAAALAGRRYCGHRAGGTVLRARLPAAGWPRGGGMTASAMAVP